MLSTTVLLLAPKAIHLLPLLGKPRAAVERSLGSGRRIVDQDDPKGGVDLVDGMRSEIVTYGAITLTYVADRVQAVQRDFGKAPTLTWQAALAACGIASKGVVAVPDGGTLNLTGGPLPAFFFVTYTGAKATIPERALMIRAPFSIVFSPSSAERQAILDAIRPFFERAFQGRKVEFAVASIAAKEGWAFAAVRPQAPGSQPLDLRHSVFAKRKRDGVLGDLSYALLHHVDGRWQKVDLAYFPTDVPWEPWAAKYAAPTSIFPNYAPQ